MKRPLKWKLFNLANIILFVIFSISLLGFMMTLIDNFKHYGVDRFLTTIAFVLGVLLMLANYLFNFYILRKYFPDKLFTKRIKITNLILICFNTLFWFIIAYAFYMGFREEYVDRSYSTSEGKIILVALGIILIMKAYVLILQFSFQSVLAKNYRENMLDLIDSLGEEKPRNVI